MFVCLSVCSIVCLIVSSFSPLYTAVCRLSSGAFHSAGTPSKLASTFITAAFPLGTTVILSSRQDTPTLALPLTSGLYLRFSGLYLRFSGLYLWSVPLVLWSVPLVCTSVPLTSGLYLWSVPLYLWSVSLVCTSGLYLWSVSLVSYLVCISG